VTLPPLPFPAVAVRIAAQAGSFCYCAHSAERCWIGVISAPTRESALLEVFRTIRADLGSGDPIRFLISLPGGSPIWRHSADLAATGCLVERAAFIDQTLVRAADLGLKDLIAQRSSAMSRPHDGAVETGPEIMDITVATDGSVRKNSSGYGWLTDDGQYGLQGKKSKCMNRKNAVLLAELGAIDDAVRALHPHRLTVLSDSTAAIDTINQWRAGQDSLPIGFSSTLLGKPSPLLDMRKRIYDSRDRVHCRWVKGHRGDPLNEGADALARLASRYVRGDSGLTKFDYESRAAGLAASFAAEFARRCA